jgi:hypothetical protein
MFFTMVNCTFILYNNRKKKLLILKSMWELHLIKSSNFNAFIVFKCIFLYFFPNSIFFPSKPEGMFFCLFEVPCSYIA